MDPKLTVVKAFGAYKTGESITDQDEIAKVLAGRGRINVVQVMAEPPRKVEIAPPDNAPAPAAPPKA